MTREEVADKINHGIVWSRTRQGHNFWKQVVHVLNPARWDAPTSTLISNRGCSANDGMTRSELVRDALEGLKQLRIMPEVQKALREMLSGAQGKCGTGSSKVLLLCDRRLDG